jgi:prephenate dehydrogenase
VSRVTIIGLGLIGGSIARGLAAKGLKDLELHGYDENWDPLKDAEKSGVFAKTHRTAREAVAGASLVVLAAPVAAIGDLLPQIASDVETGATVIDTGSTKGEVMRWAREALPAGVNFIGTHPMAGKEQQGFANSSADLFNGAAWCLCPSATASEDSINSVIGMVTLLGANSVFIDPDEHDQYVAAVSHLPLMMSTALFQLSRHSIAWEDMSLLAASGFKDSTRLASGDPLMARDILLTNTRAVEHWIDRFVEELLSIKQLVLKAPEDIFRYFADAKVERDVFLETQPKQRQMRAQENMPSGREEMMRLFVGGWAMDKAKQLPEQMKADNEKLRERLDKMSERDGGSKS